VLIYVTNASFLLLQPVANPTLGGEVGAEGQERINPAFKLVCL
jgi:hypothetical protein